MNCTGSDRSKGSSYISAYREICSDETAADTQAQGPVVDVAVACSRLYWNSERSSSEAAKIWTHHAPVITKVIQTATILNIILSPLSYLTLSKLIDGLISHGGEVFRFLRVIVSCVGELES